MKTKVFSTMRDFFHYINHANKELTIRGTTAYNKQGEAVAEVKLEKKPKIICTL